MARKMDTGRNGKVSKAHAFRAASEKLGMKANLDEVHKYILDTFKIDMPKVQISQYRSNEKRRIKKSGRKAKAAAAPAGEGKVVSKAPVAKTSSVLDFIKAVRGFENQLGASEICNAIDALYRTNS